MWIDFDKRPKWFQSGFLVNNSQRAPTAAHAGFTSASLSSKYGTKSLRHNSLNQSEDVESFCHWTEIELGSLGFAAVIC